MKRLFFYHNTVTRKGDSCSDETTENYHLNSWFDGLLLSNFQQFVWLPGKLCWEVFVDSQRSHSVFIACSRLLFSEKKLYRLSVHYLLTKLEMSWGNVVEHLVAKQPDVSLLSW